MLENTELHFQFDDIFDLEDVQRMQDSFSDATSIASIITYPDGTPITKPTNFCRLCKDLIRKTEKGLANCMKSDAEIGRFNNADYTIKCCMSGGLWDAGVPIVVNGKHVANWLIGQVRDSDFDNEKLIRYADEIGADKAEFMQALVEVPLMSPVEFEKITKLLYVFSKELCERGYANLKLKMQIAERDKAYNLLQKSEESASVTLQSIGDGVIATDKQGLVVKMNPVAEKMCGWNLSDALGKPLTTVFKIVNAANRIPVEDPVRKVLETGNVVGLANHTILVSKDGSEYQIADSAAPIKELDGTISGVVLVFSDVTAKYETESKLRELERSKSVLLSNLPGIAYRCRFDKQWTMEFVSDGCFDLTGYHAQDLMDNHHVSFSDLILPEYREHLWMEWIKAVQNRGVVRQEYRIITAGNIEKWVWEQGAPVFNEAGEVVALEGLIIDITDRKKTEEGLYNEHLLLRTLIDNIPDAIYSKDLLGRKTLANKAEINYLNANSESEVLGKTDFDFYPETIARSIFDIDQNVMQSGQPLLNQEGEVVDKNGQLHWILTSTIPLRDKNDQVVGLVGIGRDITNRKQAAEELRKSEEKYRKIFENVQDVFFQIDMAGNILEVSPSIKYFPEFDKAEVLSASVLNIYANPDERPKLLDQLKTYGEVRDYEIDLKSRTGVIKHVSINARLIYDESGQPNHIDGALRDISLRKAAEDALRESELKFRNYIDFAPHGVFVANEKGKYVEVNAAATVITGYSMDELLSITPTELVSEEYAEEFSNHFLRSVREGFATDEFMVVRKDKTTAFCTVDTVKLSETRYLGFVVDITKRKATEEALLENEVFLRETQQIARLGNCSVDLRRLTWQSSEVLDEIFGIEAGFERNYAGWLSVIHPDFEKSVAEHFIRDVVENKTEFNKKVKIIRQTDKEERWVHAIGELKYDKNGRAIKMIASVQDITERKNTMEALRKSEALYRSILKASPDVVVLLDMDGCITMVSPSAMTLCVCSNENNLLGKNALELISPEDRERAKANAFMMFDRYLGMVEYKILRADGSSFFADVNGDLIWDIDGKPTGMVFIIHDVTKRKLVEQKLNESKEQLKSFAAHLQSVREEERVSLAREIHDELGQILIAMKIDLGMLKQKVLKNAETANSTDILTKFEHLFGLVDNTIKTTRKIMTDLRPEVLYLLGFVEAVRLHVSTFEKRHGVKCHLHTDVPNLNLTLQQSVALYRIVQEALTNVARHSMATSVNIRLREEGSMFCMEIIDNGVGFDETKKTKNDSYGLIGMRERIFLLEGDLQILSSRGEGTTILVEVPFSKATE